MPSISDVLIALYLLLFLKEIFEKRITDIHEVTPYLNICANTCAVTHNMPTHTQM
jgi:hypothetical protein